jgi:hypothetical protein
MSTEAPLTGAIVTFYPAAYCTAATFLYRLKCLISLKNCCAAGLLSL